MGDDPLLIRPFCFNQRIRMMIATAFIAIFILAGTGLANTANQEMSTYRNRRYGFSIKHPSNWVVESDIMGLIVLFGAPPGKPDNVVIDAKKLPLTSDLQEYHVDSEKHLKANSTFYRKEKEYKAEIAGEPAIIAIFTFAAQPWPDMVYKKKMVIVVKDETAYIVICTAPKDYTYSEGDVFDKMIRSFQFVSKEVPLATPSPTEELSLKMKTYTDLTYKFSIQHPESWNVLTDFAGNAVWFSKPMTPDVLKKTDYTTNVAVSKPAVRSVIEATLTLEDLVRQAEVAYKDMLPSYHRVEKSQILINGEPAIVLVFTSSLEEIEEKQMAIKSKHIFLLKDENLYIITCNALQQNYDESDNIFEEMIHSFLLPETAQKSTPVNKIRPLIIGLIVGLLFYLWSKTKKKS